VYFFEKCSLRNWLPEVFNHFPNSTNFLADFIGAKMSADASLLAVNFALLSAAFWSAFTSSFKKNNFHSFSNSLLPAKIEVTMLL